MNLEQNVKELSNKVAVIKNQIFNEESTKTSLIIPFFRMLGYDFENPQKVIAEYSVEGDRVDYSIMQDEQPLLFIEAKSIKENLSKHKSQIEKYFNNSDVKIICLTNGLDYEFYTDLDKSNVIDSEPFFKFNIENITTFEIGYLMKLTKDNFKIEESSEIAYHIKTIEFIRHELENPSEEFIRFVADNVSKKKKTKKFLSSVKTLIVSSVKSVINLFVNGEINFPQIAAPNNSSNPQVITTEEELEGYKIIISILSEVYSIDNLNYKDTKSYFAIIADKKPGQWIARLCLGIKKKSIVIQDTRYYINSIEDIYNYKDELIESAGRYLAIKVEAPNVSESEDVQIKQEPEVIEAPRKKKKIRDWLIH